MFEYFPGNYVWNLGVVATLNSGGFIDEVDRACLPVRQAIERGEQPGSPEFLSAWTAVVDGLESAADADLARGRTRSAGKSYVRATNYLLQAERMQSPHSEGRVRVYQRCLDLLAKGLDLVDPATTRVAVPFGDTTLPGYFTDASVGGRPAPVLIMWNGLDSTKEHIYLSYLHEELKARGISTLMVDCPGSGEALRLGNLTAVINTEVWATACVDYLETRADVDASAIGLAGWSLGGYYAPRAAAFEKRVKLCVAWGANHDWGAVQLRRRLREGERPVPHYWAHVLWVWGYDDLDAFIDFSAAVNLNGVVDKITVPFLITHGENDRQIPVSYAHDSFDQATASPKRELRLFSVEEGAAEHIGLDHLPHAVDVVSDWVAETFVELRA